MELLARLIQGPEEYLTYSHHVLSEAKTFDELPEIKKFYEELCVEFKAVFSKPNNNFFTQLGQLLAIDAQIQILLELVVLTTDHLLIDLQMTESEIIQMIQRDRKTFYREITGSSINENPKWALIYLSEEYYSAQ